MAHPTKDLQEILEGFHSLKRVLEVKSGTCMFGDYAITNGQWLALHVIARTEDASIKDICSALGVTSSAATQVVNDLVAAKMVEKRASTKDARAVAVSLTPKTKKVLVQFRTGMLQNMSKLFSVLTPEEFDTYRTLHAKLVTSFTK